MLFSRSSILVNAEAACVAGNTEGSCARPVPGLPEDETSLMQRSSLLLRPETAAARKEKAMANDDDNNGQFPFVYTAGAPTTIVGPAQFPAVAPVPVVTAPVPPVIQEQPIVVPQPPPDPVVEVVVMLLQC